MATYNRAHLIPETLKAIQNQSYANFECIIVDDGSTDSTAKIIKELNLDSRFKYSKRSENYTKGPSGCRNFGLDRASGNYVIFFDDDDIPHPINLELCVNEINKDNYDFCRYQRKVFYEDFHYNFNLNQNFNSFIIKEKEGVLNLLSQRTPFNCCAVMWDKKCFKNVRFNEQLVYAEEWECFQRILVNGAVGISIDKTLFFARKHISSSTGSSSNKNSKQYKSILDAVKMVIPNISKNGLMEAEFVKFFAWESVRYDDKSIFKCLLSQPLSFKNKIIAYRTYYFSPFIKQKIKLKKKFKLNL